MYLSKLEMVGFKSFGLKTDLDFTDGVTAIVGPNGCGKTNVVDAIRWVLGEQKTSMLRADSMDQVIFNGSRTRKPLGMAEVSLTIENNKAILPTEYSQVVITRRLFRNGESQYLLNKTQCRLRDIVDLFMDTGMGSDAYSVIELKMIETILSDKADERRHLFEEAAGVTKYKARRREAQRKLDAAQRDIARVQDIVREVQKTVNSLGRQAEKARQHQELSTKLRELDRLLFAFEYAEEYALLIQLQTIVQGIRERREASEKGIVEHEQSVAESEQLHQQTDADLRAAMLNETDVRTALAEIQQTISLIIERSASTKRALERLDREHDESQNQQSSTSEELKTVQERIVTIQQDHEVVTKELNDHRVLVGDAQAMVDAARAEMVACRENLSAAKQTLSEKTNLADRHRVQLDALARRQRDLGQQQQSAQDRMRQVEEQIGREGADLPAIEQQLADAEQRLHSAEERQRELEQLRDALQKELEDYRSALAHSKASLEFLTGLVDTTESSKFLLNTNEWQPSGERVTLAEVVNTKEDYRVAIEAALGDSGRYFVVANRQEAKQAIAALSKNNVGKATFLCRDTIPSLQMPAQLSGVSGIVGWASEIVETDDQLRNALRSLLTGTVVVDTLDTAWGALAHNGVSAAVTLAGEIVHASGAMRGGSVSKTEGVRVGRRERIEQLNEAIEKLEATIAERDSQLSTARQELSGIDLRRLGDEVRKMALIRNDRQQRIDALRGRIEDILSQQQSLHDEMQRIAEEVQVHSTDLSSMESEIADAHGVVQSKELQINQAEQHLRAMEDNSNSRLAELRAVEIKLVRLQGEMQNLSTDEQRLTNQSLTIDQRREQRSSERTDLVGQLDQLHIEKLSCEEESAKILAKLTEVKSNRESLELLVKGHAAAVQEGSEQLRAERKGLDMILSEQYDADVKLSEIKVRLESLVRRATEELDLVPETEPSAPQSDVAPEQLRIDVQELRRRLTSMGNVNFLALEEHERENERLQFLLQQLADLTESERVLNETIAEINQTAREKFTATFTAIRENFTVLFKMLFSEDDEADLQMVESDDEDPLECTIDITAKPRGKRPHSIEMLSGGEKTLTAIALLFAIYLVKPSPFCILDEVDAPLDDANIDRYLKIIRKFAENTQFLMITHNKKTMEAADTLYGVTMEEPAVSKVVSVQLSGAAA